MSLTKEQEAQIEVYKNEGVRIGLQTFKGMQDWEASLPKIRELTDKLRVGYKLPKAVNFLSYLSPMAVMRENKELTTHNAFYGNQDIHWVQTYKFDREVLRSPEIPYMEEMFELTRLVGWFWMNEETTVVTPFPSEISFLTLTDGSKITHKETGKAIRFPDGEGVYVLRCQFISPEYKDLMEASPEEMDVDRIMSITNTEIRTEFLFKAGIERIFNKANKQVVDEDTLILETYKFPGLEEGLNLTSHLQTANIKVERVKVEVPYQLFDVEIGNEIVRFLTSHCPSNGEPFFEGVPMEISTVKEALKWRNPLGRVTRTLT